MDMMALKRMVMAQMASGANFAKGTFTVPDDIYGNYVVNFGKSFSKYVFVLEMTDASKTLLVNSGQTNDRTYCCCGMYPMPQLNSGSAEGMYALVYRYKPSDQTFNAPVSTTNFVKSINESSITFDGRAVTAGTYFVYRGYTYNYYVFEIK